jgi:CRP-like cAMP-binding protein
VSPRLCLPDPARGARYAVDLIAELPASSARRLREIGIRRTYRDNQTLQQRGDAARHVLVLLSGRLRSVATTADGTEQLTRWLEPGEVSGFSSVLGDAPVPVDLVAVGKVEVLIVPRGPLLEFLASDANASLAVARMLSLRINELLDIVFIRAEDTLASRVRATLQRLAAENGVPRDNRTLLRISQGDLAAAVGASRQRVNAELRKLQAEGRIRLGYRWLELLNAG